MDEDLSVFFDPDDFAVPVIRQRAGVDDITFNGIVGQVDVEAFEGNAMAAKREVRFAGADVLEADILVIGGTPFRVLADPDRLNDGAEAVAYLTDIT